MEQFDGPMPVEGDVNDFIVLIGPFGSKKHVFEARTNCFSAQNLAAQ